MKKIVLEKKTWSVNPLIRTRKQKTVQYTNCKNWHKTESYLQKNKYIYIYIYELTYVFKLSL